MTRPRIVAIAALLAVTPPHFASLFAATYHVATNGVEGASGTAEDPFPTIQDGLNAAAKNDVVSVADGVYEISSPLTCSVQMTLKSASGNRDACIVDAKNRCACLSFTGDKALLSGMTFRNASSDDTAVSLNGASSVVSNVHVTCCSRTVTGDASGGGLKVGGMSCTVYDSVVDNCEIVDCQPVATAASLQLRGGGVYLAINACMRNTVVSNCAVRGYCNVSANKMVGGGVFGYSAAVEDCVVSHCTVSNTVNKSGGFGGGLYLTRYSDQYNPIVMRNCLIEGNDASYQSAGAHLDGAGTLVEKCAFVGNVLRPLQTVDGGAGSAFGILGTNSIVRNCQVVSNEIAGAVSTSGGGAIGAMVGPMAGSIIHDTLIADNLGSYSSAMTCRSTNLTVSNCVIRGNNSQTGLASSVIRVVTGSGGLLFADCWLTDNTSTGSTAVNGALLDSYLGGSTSAGFGLKFRNCLVTRNNFSSSTTYGLFNWWVTDASYDNTLVLENCSVAGNLGSYVYSWTFLGRNATLGGNKIYLKGCVVVGNGNKGGQNFKSSNMSTALGHMQYTYTTGNVSTDPSDETIIGTNPGFANAAAGDYRPASVSSPLVDKVPAAGTWLANRRYRDLGDGTYGISACGKYGVAIARNNALRRLSGPAADIGCFEFYQPVGLVLSFK